MTIVTGKTIRREPKPVYTDNLTIEYVPPDNAEIGIKDLRLRSVSMHHVSALILPYGFLNMKSTQTLAAWVSVRYGVPASSTGTWPADTNVRFWPFMPRNTVQVTAMRMNVSTAGGVGNEFRLNLYDGNDDTYGTAIDDAYFGWPRTKLLSTDWTFATDTTGIKSITLSPPLTLTKGRVYWMAMQNNNTSTTPNLTADVAVPLTLGISPSTFTTVHFALRHDSGVYGPLPNDISVNPGYPVLQTSALACPTLQISFTFVSI